MTTYEQRELGDSKYPLISYRKIFFIFVRRASQFLPGIVLGTVLINANLAVAAEYKPLDILFPKVEILQLKASSKKSDHIIPLKVYLPTEGSNYPVILFSHGLGGSRENVTYLGSHWAKRGYVVVAVQHTQSDESLLEGVERNQWKSRLKEGINRKSFMQRMKDIPSVIDALERWNTDKTGPLFRRLNLSKIGMSGHSFGAITTQAISGQSFFGKPRFLDSRIDAAVALSPSVPAKGDPIKAFANVTVPWFLITGTKDVVSVGGASLDDRLNVFASLPSNGKTYQLVLQGAEHYAFNDSDDRFPTRQRNPKHHVTIKATTTAFWDAYLKDDPVASRFLESDAILDEIDSKDVWSKK